MLSIFTVVRPSVRADHIAYLDPILGSRWEDPDSLHVGQFAAWQAQGAQHINRTDNPAHADVHVLSIPWKSTFDDPSALAFAKQCIETAAQHGKRIIIFFDADHDQPVTWPAHAVVFRFSLYRDRRAKNEFAYPLWSQDFTATHGNGALTPRPKNPRPVVSFCGYAPPMGSPWGKQKCKDVAKYAAYRLGLLAERRGQIAHSLRAYALRRLIRTTAVETNFILRRGFAFNQRGVLQPGGNSATASTQRNEFVNNLLNSDYALCTRGLANCSIRLYEAMSLGRIPLVVDTQCVMPFHDQLPWRDLTVWIDESEVGNIGTKLAAAHAQFTPEEFIARQHRCREFFTNWLSPVSFFRRLPEHWQT